MIYFLLLPFNVWPNSSHCFSPIFFIVVWVLCVSLLTNCLVSSSHEWLLRLGPHARNVTPLPRKVTVRSHVFDESSLSWSSTSSLTFLALGVSSSFSLFCVYFLMIWFDEGLLWPLVALSSCFGHSLLFVSSLSPKCLSLVLSWRALGVSFASLWILLILCAFLPSANSPLMLVLSLLTMSDVRSIFRATSPIRVSLRFDNSHLFGVSVSVVGFHLTKLLCFSLLQWMPVMLYFSFVIGEFMLAMGLVCSCSHEMLSPLFEPCSPD